MPSKNECLELEMKMMKAWQLARAVENTTRERFEAFAAELEQKLREMERVSHGWPQSVLPVIYSSTAVLLVAVSLAVMLV
jgi:hypothetical protein